VIVPAPKEKQLSSYKSPVEAWVPATLASGPGEMFAERTNWNLSPNRLSEALAAYHAAGKRLYDLSASNPTEEGFERPSETVLNALANEAALTYEHGRQIDFHALEQRITPRTRAIIVVNPNNPSGHFTKAEELATLNDICSVRGMALIADEVFLDFAYAETTGRRDVPKNPRN